MSEAEKIKNTVETGVDKDEGKESPQKQTK